MDNFILIKNVDVLTCPKCHDQIWSKHRHNMVHCSCGTCFIDGGRDYTRFGMLPLVEPSVRQADIIYNKLNNEYKIHFNDEEKKK